MGEVYLAQDAQLDRLVAIKILSAEIARDQQRLSRFLQEARAASKLKSANVVHIYENWKGRRTPLNRDGVRRRRTAQSRLTSIGFFTHSGTNSTSTSCWLKISAKR